MAESVLKHVQRAKVVAYIIDLSSETCYEDYLFLRKHVNLRIGYNLRELIVCNKADLPATEEQMLRLREKMKGSKRTVLVPICAKEGLGLVRVINILERQVEEARKEEKEAEEERNAHVQGNLIGVGHGYY